MTQITETVRLVPVEIIQANPYQMRDSEDPEHIAKLADSIARDGLLQYPLARPGAHGDQVVLAFGHSRLAAYKLLKERSDRGEIMSGGDLTDLAKYHHMPVIVRELSDEQMFVYGTQENIARKNLTPVEEAKLMRIYREKFGKTSAEIGRLFGMSESAVRNKMRLVDLPEAAIAGLNEGKITEVAARRLLSLNDVIPTPVINDLAKHIATTEYSKPEQVDNSIRTVILAQKESIQLYEPYNQSKDKAQNLFMLDWQPAETLPAPTYKQFKRFFQQDQEPVTIQLPSVEGLTHINGGISVVQPKEIFEHLYVVFLRTEGEQPSTVGKLIAEKAPEMAKAINHLAHPPECKKCPFFVSVQNEGICGRKICFERKRDAWIKIELARVSAETGIAIYDPEVDGKLFEDENWATRDRFKKMWEEKSPDLRLRGRVSKWGPDQHTQSRAVDVISISKASIASQSKNQNNLAFQQERERLREEREKQEKERVGRAAKYLDAVASEFGGFLYSSHNAGTLNVLCRIGRIRLEGEFTKADCLNRLGRDFVGTLVDWSMLREGPAVVADYLIGVAAEMGMKPKLDLKALVQELAEGALAPAA
ncbi:MAG TPA: ParB/RepB/Spo0J family partition protein [Bellilinea sp.]